MVQGWTARVSVTACGHNSLLSIDRAHAFFTNRIQQSLHHLLHLRWARNQCSTTAWWDHCQSTIADFHSRSVWYIATGLAVAGYVIFQMAFSIARRNISSISCTRVKFAVAYARSYEPRDVCVQNTNYNVITIRKTATVQRALTAGYAV